MNHRTSSPLFDDDIEVLADQILDNLENYKPSRDVSLREQDHNYLARQLQRMRDGLRGDQS